MALTNTYRNKIVDSLTGRTNTLGTSQIYIGLSSTCPNASGNEINEPSSTSGYSRTQIGKVNNSDSYLFPAAVNGEAKNEKHIYFTEATEAWGTLSYFILATSPTGTGSSIVGYAPLTNEDGEISSITVDKANTVVLFRPGALTIKYVDAVIPEE